MDLLLILKITREERSWVYTTLKNVLKAQGEVNVPQELKNDSEGDYVRFTAYVNQLQEILIDRLGYYPKRIDRKFLENYESKLM